MNSIYGETLSDRSLHPINKDKKIDETSSFTVVNSSCGDKYVIKVREENGIIADISFSGTGCAISQASADMMADFLVGKKTSDIEEYYEKFRKVIKDGDTQEDLGELNEFRIIAKMPMRAKCAELPWTICIANR